MFRVAKFIILNIFLSFTVIFNTVLPVQAVQNLSMQEKLKYYTETLSLLNQINSMISNKKTATENTKKIRIVETHFEIFKEKLKAGTIEAEDTAQWGSFTSTLQTIILKIVPEAMEEAQKKTEKRKASKLPAFQKLQSSYLEFQKSLLLKGFGEKLVAKTGVSLEIIFKSVKDFHDNYENYKLNLLIPKKIPKKKSFFSSSESEDYLSGLDLADSGLDLLD